jgi:hypothetical protein
VRNLAARGIETGVDAEAVRNAVPALRAQPKRLGAEAID